MLRYFHPFPAWKTNAALTWTVHRQRNSTHKHTYFILCVGRRGIQAVLSIAPQPHPWAADNHIAVEVVRELLEVFLIADNLICVRFVFFHLAHTIVSVRALSMVFRSRMHIGHAIQMIMHISTKNVSILSGECLCSNLMSELFKSANVYTAAKQPESLNTKKKETYLQFGMIFSPHYHNPAFNRATNKTPDSACSSPCLLQDAHAPFPSFLKPALVSGNEERVSRRTSILYIHKAAPQVTSHRQTRFVLSCE